LNNPCQIAGQWQDKKNLQGAYTWNSQPGEVQLETLSTLFDKLADWNKRDFYYPNEIQRQKHCLRL